jgi:hypothetical protein
MFKNKKSTYPRAREKRLSEVPLFLIDVKNQNLFSLLFSKENKN